MIANSLIGWSRRIGLATVTVALAAPALAAESGGGGLPQLDTSTFPTQIFWLIVSFVLLYVIMAKVAVPRIADVLEERQERIEDDIETADRLRGEAEGVRAEYEAALAEAHAKAQEMIRQATAEIAAANTQAETDAAQKTAETTKAAEARIAEQRTQAMASLKSVASEAAAEATAKLTGLSVGAETVGAAVDAAMADAPAAQGGA
jgi:F-type H+-transporting ATPase subunit b